jgi:hypothetical protein
MNRTRTSRLLVALVGSISGAACLALGSLPVRADYSSWEMSTQEKEVLDYGPGGSGSSSSGSLFNSTNPLDLMNKLLRGMAMDDATPPGDAVDAALRDLDAQRP